MELALGKYEDRKALKEMVDRFSPEQLESLYQYMKLLDKGFSSEKGPEGKIINGFINMTLEKTSDTSTISTLPLRWEMYNGIGVIHGGVTATFIDNAMGKTLRECYSGKLARQVTIELKINYIKGGKGEKLIAETEILQAGKSLAVMECSVRDDENDLVAKAIGTFRVWPNK